MRRKLNIFAALLVTAICISNNWASAQNFADITPSPQQLVWQDLEFGVIIHFGTNTFLDREWGDGTAPPSSFAPTHFDPDQWMKAIKSAGAKYVVIVAKHHDGFALWPTAQSPYSVKSSPWLDGSGDVVGAAAAAAKRDGLKFGVYLSPWDRHEPRYSDPGAYDKFYLAQLEELSSRYGELTELWLDGAGSCGRSYDFNRIIETLRIYQPNTIVFADTGLFEYGDARWSGNESGRIDYDNWNVVDRHGYRRWRPVEVDTPLRKLHWFWHPNDDASLKTVDELLASYEGSIGHGAQWMLGIAPDNTGRIPDADVARLSELGNAIVKRYGPDSNVLLNHKPTDRNSEAAVDGNLDTVWSAPEHTHSARLDISLPMTQSVNRSRVMEDLIAGQQIIRYRIKAWVKHRWLILAEGGAIGHAKIDCFPPVRSDRFSLEIVTSAGTARIREFSIFAVAK